jgi:hypothetical protein
MISAVLINTFVALAVFFLPISNVFAGPRALHHDIDVSLFPREKKLVANDAVAVNPGGAPAVEFTLSEKASVSDVRVNGRTQSFTLTQGRLIVPLKAYSTEEAVSVSIVYAASFDDAAPETPLNTDNPGYGVSGVISEKGIFLQAGAGWYPEIPGSQPSYDLSVTAPAGILAVSAGEPLGHRTDGTKTISTWKIRYPVEGLSLSAGPYQVKTQQAGKVKVMTYFHEQNGPLSRQYLDASGQYIALYEKLIGPYPFEKFAVVENFFPTGYGFPSYTLLGSTVLRLPFIIQTSLGHEIAHSWWGNGVLVDFERGNWCEGLTTYLADYLFKERSSQTEAREHRLQILRSFTTLVSPEQDFPLRRFTGRYDPGSQAIGYGKAAFVFHMLRQRLGDKAFWEGLRKIYRERLFKKTSWKDFQEAFEQEGERSLDTFFDQWVSRKGAPRISLDRVDSSKEAGSYRVRARLTQSQPFYDLELPVVLSTRSRSLTEKIALSGESTVVQISSEEKPLHLAVDPDFHAFRVLDAEEIPPSVNSLKGAASVTIVVSSSLGQDLRNLAETFAAALGLNTYRVILDKEIAGTALGEEDILLIGFQGGVKEVKLPPGVAVAKESFVVEGQTFSHPSDALFGIFPHPRRKSGFVALYHPLSMNYARDLARKITHYGRYSYLVFREGQNRVKGIWPVLESPLIHRWDKEG